MPHANCFRHQVYWDGPPAAEYHLLRPGPQPPVGSEEFCRRMAAVGAALRANNVAAVYLAHGTFAGTDGLGVLAEIERFFPAFADKGRGWVKQVLDAIAGDAGVFTVQYARRMEEALNGGEGVATPPAPPSERGERAGRIPVRLFGWSSENHHLGRADGAVRLVEELCAGAGADSGDPPCPPFGKGGGSGERGFAPGERVLLFGHSHAGNVFALATNLLSGDRESVEKFFDAAKPFYFRRGKVDLPRWAKVRELLLGGGENRPLSGVALDMVTLGTPIRYGWDSGGYAKLLHFINHRPCDGLADCRAPFPPDPEHVASGRYGDFIQQFGIAGTNTPPSLAQWRALLADRRLNRMLQREVKGTRMLYRWRCGQRVPAEGVTLLVEYSLPEGKNVVQHLAGHAVYTREEWMLFHAEEAAGRLYGALGS
jgi:hypothetical protein